MELLLIHIYVIAGIFVSIIPFFILYRFWFFLRNPGRRIPEGNVIVAPADGWINYIKEIKDNEVPLSVKKGRKIVIEELMDDPQTGYTLVIGIYMTPLSVHYNRIPFSGTVKKVVYRGGKENMSMLRALLNLLFRLTPYAEGLFYLLENERNTTVIEGDGIKGAVVQIADKWVRQIVSDCKPGDSVEKGETFGLIRMGSQCDLFLKIDGKHRILVKERDYVRAGSSALIDLALQGPLST